MMSIANRMNAMRGPRFEQTNMEFQPMPRSAIELIAQEPIRLVNTRIASCDGGKLDGISSNLAAAHQLYHYRRRRM